jgi:hypothetical protein
MTELHTGLVPPVHEVPDASIPHTSVLLRTAMSLVPEGKLVLCQPLPFQTMAAGWSSGPAPVIHTLSADVACIPSGEKLRVPGTLSRCQRVPFQCTT